jgi:hypothetical protein
LWRRRKTLKHIRGALDEAMNFRGPALVKLVISQGSSGAKSGNRDGSAAESQTAGTTTNGEKLIVHPRMESLAPRGQRAATLMLKRYGDKAARTNEWAIFVA